MQKPVGACVRDRQQRPRLVQEAKVAGTFPGKVPATFSSGYCVTVVTPTSSISKTSVEYGGIEKLRTSP